MGKVGGLACVPSFQFSQHLNLTIKNLSLSLRQRDPHLPTLAVTLVPPVEFVLRVFVTLVAAELSPKPVCRHISLSLSLLLESRGRKVEFQVFSLPPPPQRPRSYPLSLSL